MPRRRNNKIFMIFRIIGIFIVGMIVAVIVALSQVNLETLRGNILSILRDASGMPVEIDGTVSWKLSLRPRIELNQVRIPSADWSKCDSAFRAERLIVTINLLSLFQDRPTLQNVKVYDATLCLEKNSAGKISWPNIAEHISETGLASQEAASATSPSDVAAASAGATTADCTDCTDAGADVTSSAPQKPKWPFEDPGLGGVEIRNLTANIFGDTYSVAGFNVRYFPHMDRREYAGWIRSTEKVYPFIISFSEYNADRKIYPVRFAMSTGGQALIANVALEGTSLAPIDFKISGDIPNVAELGAVVGLSWPDMPKISLDLAGGYDWNKFTMRRSSVAIPGTRVVFSGEYDWSKKIPAVTLNLESDRISLVEMFPGLYAHTWTRPNRELNVFKDVPLYGRELRNHNVTLNVKLGQFIVYRDFNIRDMNVSARLHGSVARLDGSANIGGGNVRIASDIDIDADGVLDVVAAASASDVSVGQILSEFNNSDFITGLSLNAKAYLRGHGATLDELMATATGPVQAYSTEPGWVHSGLVVKLYGADFLTSLRHGIEDLFRTEKQHDQIKISCASLNAKLRDGHLETDHGFAVETNAINIRLAGNIDLGDETMKLSLTTVPVRGLKLSLGGNLVNSIEITGNLAEPDVKISGAAVAGKVASATGLGLLLAPFTGGLGLVAGAGVGLLAGDLLENWLADDSPCKTAMRKGAPARRNDAEWINAPLDELVGTMLGDKKE